MKPVPVPCGTSPPMGRPNQSVRLASVVMYTTEGLVRSNSSTVARSSGRRSDGIGGSGRRGCAAGSSGAPTRCAGASGRLSGAQAATATITSTIDNAAPRQAATGLAALVRQGV